MCPLPTPAILVEQAVPLQQRVQRTARRPGAVRVPRAEDPQQLLGPPPVLLPRPDDERFEILARPMRRAASRARTRSRMASSSTVGT